MSLLEEIRDFTISVFEDLNGKINSHIKANALYFQLNQNPDVMGSGNYQYIVVYLENIINKCNSHSVICTEIVATIVHELMHYNQTIDTLRYYTDSAYRDSIEDECNKLTDQWFRDSANGLDPIISIVPDITKIKLFRLNYLYFKDAIDLTKYTCDTLLIEKISH